MSLEELTLGSICDQGGGVIRTGPFGSQLHESDYSNIGTPVVMPKDIIQGKVSEQSIARVSDEHVNRLSQHKLLPGDIVYGRRGDIGRQALIRERESGWLCGTGCLRITLGTGPVDPKWLHYYLRDQRVVAFIAQQAVGATMPNLNTSILRSIPIRFPSSLETQRRIASILSTYDDLIENNTRRIAILEEMARRIYEEWFVHFRFPGHEQVKMVESELGLIPEGWLLCRLEDVCSRITDGSHSSPKSVEVGKPMASVKDMTDWGINTSTCRIISDEDYLKLVRNDCKPRLNDVLIAKDGSYLKHTFVVDEEIDLVILSSIAILRPNGRFLPNQLAIYLRLPQIKERMKGYVSGVAIPRIILKDFRQFLILLPPSSLQSEWAKICDPMLSLCRKLVRKNANLRATRDLLLPKLISGELDVSNLPTPEEASAA